MRALVCGAGLLLLMGGTRVRAQAAALPSAQSAPVTDPAERGHALLQQMVEALGGQRWLSVNTERIEGGGASFYEGRPNPYETHFEEYLQLEPFGERVVIVSKQGQFISTTKRDVAEVWTPAGGFEVDYHGRKPLPPKEVQDFERRRAHTIDTVVRHWLKDPNAIVTYEGTDLDDRHLVDKVSIINSNNDAVTLGLDQASHLPRSRTFQWRDPVYKDLNTDVERYDNWQPEEGLMTALTITRWQNDEMVSQRFLTKVQYGLSFDPALFDPDRPLSQKVSGK